MLLGHTFLKFRTLLIFYFRDMLMKYGVAIRFIGDISLFNAKIRKSVAEIVELTKDNNK